MEESERPVLAAVFSTKQTGGRTRTKRVPAFLRCSSFQPCPRAFSNSLLGREYTPNMSSRLAKNRGGVQRALLGPKTFHCIDFCRPPGWDVAGDNRNDSQSELPAVVTLELSNLDGSSTGLSGSINVPANGQAAMFLNQVQGFASFPLSFRGVLRVSSAATISIL